MEANRDMMKRVPVREQDPKERATNFKEVCLGYDMDEAMAEAVRCLNCKNAQCVKGCPVSIDIPAFVQEVKEGNIEKAAEIIAKSSALPAVCGRVCPQESQCEGKCIRGIKGEPVSIGKLERFVADWAREHGFVPKAAEEKNGKRVAVIGSGPAGLTCAGDLAKLGYEVKIFEALHEAGGVLTYGIPEFRLPKSGVVQPEIDNVRKLGVEIETNVVIGKSVTIDELMEKEGFDAVFIGSGAGLPKFMGIPGENSNGVFSANEYLTRSNLMKAFRDDYDTPIAAGHKVAVVGGGNVAMDAARTALRLGAEVYIVYRRSEKELPARVEEVHHAKEEGIQFHLLTNPVEILADEQGWVKGIVCRKMELGFIICHCLFFYISLCHVVNLHFFTHCCTSFLFFSSLSQTLRQKHYSAAITYSKYSIHDTKNTGKITGIFKIWVDEFRKKWQANRRKITIDKKGNSYGTACNQR